MGRILGLVFFATGLLIAAAPAGANASSPEEVALPGVAFFPESITAAPDGALFVSSLTTGEIVRLAPGSQRETTFVKAGVNVGTAGVMVDPDRDVLWACAVDLRPKPRPSCARSTCGLVRRERATRCPTAACVPTSPSQGAICM